MKRKERENKSDKIVGSMNALSTMQITTDMEGLDVESKVVLHSKEVLAVILQGIIEEYKGYSLEEIMNFIETDSIAESLEVSTGRTNTQIRSDTPEFVQLNEKTSHFDVMFRAVNPMLSNNDVRVNLHIDVESQKTYRPGYPIEKRGLYYLARSLSAQLSLVTGTTDYNCLEKCYSIWICRDAIPKEEQYSISFYEMVNTKNIGYSESHAKCLPEENDSRKNYDLQALVIIRLGNKVYNGKKGDEGFELLRFLNAIMYPHQDNFMETISEYIDFSKNEELKQEVEHMGGLGQSILEEGIEQGIEQGIEWGIERGIQAFILDYVEEDIPRDRILAKLQKRFELSREKAEAYFEKFAGKDKSLC